MNTSDRVQQDGMAAELERAQQSLRELQELARIGLWEWDVALDRVMWSEEMYRIAGLDPSEPVDLARYNSLHHPEDAERIRAVVGAALESGEPYRMDHRLVRPDGTVVWVEGRGVAERDEAGRVTRLFGTAQDITMQREAERQARELELERRGRERAEDSARRLEFLAKASEVLASSLDYEETLRNVAALAVPGLADWCAVDLVVGRGLQRVAVQHSDPAKVDFVYAIEAEYPSDPDAATGAPNVARTGTTEWMRRIPDELLEQAAVDERHLGLIRQLGLGSYIAAPLNARHRTLGVISVVQAESGREFDESDVALMEDLARRAAVAIDNARLVRDIEEAQTRLEEQSAELEVQAAEMEMQTEQLEIETHRARSALAELAEERTLLAAIIEHAPVGIVIAEASSGRIVMGNTAAERMLRHPVLMSQGVDHYAEWVAYHPDGSQVAAHEYPLAETLRTGRAAGPLDVHYQRGDGTRAWIRIVGAPLLNADGEVTGALVVLDDIDDVYRAEQEREKLLAQVSAERARLRQIFDVAPAVMALYSGPEQVVTLVNPTWLATVGKEDAVGRPFREVFPEFAETGLFEQLQHSYETGEPWRNPEAAVPLVRWGRPPENTVWDVVWQPLPRRDDGTRDILVHAVEITAQVRARIQVQRLADAAVQLQAAGSLGDVLQVLADEARTIIEARHATATISAAGEQDITAESRDPGFDDVAPSEQITAPLLAHGGGALGSIVVRGRHHGGFSANDRAVLVQLAQLGSAALENTRLYEEAVEANRTKSDFLATMSHELRTPLNAMIGYSDLLQMGVPEPIPAASLNHVERIRLAAQHLLQLIEEILTFSRMEAGRERLHIEDVQLGTLVDEVRAIIEPLAAQKNLAFAVDVPDEPVSLRTDSRKVRQVLLNLLGNAIKFTQEGRVRFECRIDGDTLVFRVTDTGVGIAQEHIERIFEPFWQAESAMHTRTGGTGLGLPLTRKFVDLLDGTLEVSSEPGVGSEFVARLPRRARTEAGST